MRQHLCNDEWVEGGVESCTKHGSSGRRQKPVRYGKKARRKMDRQAGTIGQDSGGGYING